MVSVLQNWQQASDLNHTMAFAEWIQSLGHLRYADFFKSQ
jgi:hypothetical protein